MVDATITRVTYRWDDRLGVEPGWYVETWADREFVADSQKVWFPVAVDDFGRGDSAELVTVLRCAFPSAGLVLLE